MIKSVVARYSPSHVPLLKIPDLFVIRRVQLVLLLRDPLVDHLVHLWSRVSQWGDNKSRRYLQL